MFCVCVCVCVCMCVIPSVLATLLQKRRKQVSVRTEDFSKQWLNWWSLELGYLGMKVKSSRLMRKIRLKKTLRFLWICEISSDEETKSKAINQMVPSFVAWNCSWHLKHWGPSLWTILHMGILKMGSFHNTELHVVESQVLIKPVGTGSSPWKSVNRNTIVYFNEKRVPEIIEEIFQMNFLC